MTRGIRIVFKLATFALWVVAAIVVAAVATRDHARSYLRSAADDVRHFAGAAPPANVTAKAEPQQACAVLPPESPDRERVTQRAPAVSVPAMTKDAADPVPALTPMTESPVRADQHDAHLPDPVREVEASYRDESSERYRFRSGPVIREYETMRRQYYYYRISRDDRAGQAADKGTR